MQGDPEERDTLYAEHKIIAIEMESAGIKTATSLSGNGYLAIRGICDYCDGTKNDDWQNYASAVAAAYTYALIESLPTKDANQEKIQMNDKESSLNDDDSKAHVSSRAKVRFPGSMPFNNLPYLRNEYFSGRDETLENINNAFHSESTVALTQTITGMGGVGKTQTALEYAYRYSDEYEYIWWVTAETEDAVVTSYKDFAVKLGLLDNEQYDKAVIIETVLNWMNTHPGWLFIFDNVEEPTRDSPWWPRNNKENILITTRRHPNNIGKTLDINIFSEDEAVSFLTKRTGIADDSSASILSERLGYLPLALEQAAAYIVNTDSSYFEYIDRFDEHKLILLEEIDGIINYNKPVTVTLKISIDNMKDDEAARQLLYLCSYLASENIDPGLFRENLEHCPSPLKETLSNSIETDKIWAKLRNYSLLQKQDASGYSMHRLLQKVIRKELQSDTQWARHVLDVLHAAYRIEYGTVDTHNSFIQISPHIEVCIGVCTYLQLDDTAQEIIASLYDLGGRGFYSLGNYEKALEWYEKALAIREKVLGEEHPDTASTYNNMATTFEKQHKYEKALDLYEKALAIREKVLGEEHPDTATIYNNMALTYDYRGSPEKALEWYEKALAIRKKVLGEEHPDTATTYNNIALAYTHKRDYGKAIEWYTKALSVFERVLGVEHLYTATTYSNIGYLYSELGDYGKALQWCISAVPIFEKVLGKEHYDTTAPYHIIIDVYYRLGDYSRTQEWLEKVIIIYEKALGQEHPDIATAYNNIGILQEKRGRYEKALVWYGKALAIREKVLGIEHPDTIAIKSCITDVVNAMQG